jgi:hypothetical protein
MSITGGLRGEMSRLLLVTADDTLRTSARSISRRDDPTPGTRNPYPQPRDLACLMQSERESRFAAGFRAGSAGLAPASLWGQPSIAQERFERQTSWRYVSLSLSLLGFELSVLRGADDSPFAPPWVWMQARESSAWVHSAKRT